MKDFVKYFKFMRYALQFKMIIILAIVFFCLGIFFELTDFSGGNSFSLAGLYLALTAVYFYQLVFSTTVSKMVQASPMKKKLQTSGPMIVTTLFSLFTFTVYVVLRCIRITPEYLIDNDTTWANCYSSILYAAFFATVLLVYSAFSYKSYVLSIIFISVSVILLMLFGSTRNIFANISSTLWDGSDSPLLIIIVSYAMIIFGAVLGYILSLLIYKKEISEMAVRVALRQAQSK